MPFFRDVTRLTAEQLVRENPSQPILRPCSFTDRYPTVLSVTYMNNGTLCNSLVDKCRETGRFYGVIINDLGKPERTRERGFSSIDALERILRGLSYPPCLEDPEMVIAYNASVVDVCDDPVPSA